MRTKVIFIIIFLLTMAFLPIIISKCSSPQTAVTSNSTADKATEPVTANEPSKKKIPNQKNRRSPNLTFAVW